jgi:hypothetical protein
MNDVDIGRGDAGVDQQILVRRHDIEDRFASLDNAAAGLESQTDDRTADRGRDQRTLESVLACPELLLDLGQFPTNLVEVTGNLVRAFGIERDDLEFRFADLLPTPGYGREVLAAITDNFSLRAPNSQQLRLRNQHFLKEEFLALQLVGDDLQTLHGAGELRLVAADLVADLAGALLQHPLAREKSLTPGHK